MISSQDISIVDYYSWKDDQEEFFINDFSIQIPKNLYQMESNYIFGVQYSEPGEKTFHDWLMTKYTVQNKGNLDNVKVEWFSGDANDKKPKLTNPWSQDVSKSSVVVNDDNNTVTMKWRFVRNSVLHSNQNFINMSWG
eukprot:CAMPEP_0176365202 /NCGR_PEP_ID=MMETSP0126-20121128/20299_1 /TAXON_ID=141414 ORGANISM="Strombidinopsis acuminatum, Strain SPMC142" /NCGR_SAMPLE_ID=MMETSP0126 /ASSEMBLY_ACC=CAM_ASM_000229 /LENGTH=137 /DNA_ID=CAMNT_0017722097 /DNA_START=96 /DNA_END=509 /DNA_ORIENTATION=-